MSLQTSGAIGLGQVNTELGRQSNSEIPLGVASTGGVVPLNPCSFFGPTADGPDRQSEWYGFDQTQPCLISQRCAGYSNSSIDEVCRGLPDCDHNQPYYQPFDYMIMRWRWASDSGSNIQVVEAYKNTGIPSVDLFIVGTGWDFDLPTTSPITTSFLSYYPRDANVRQLPFSVNFKSLLNTYPSITANPITLQMDSGWTGGTGTGLITIQYLTYSGGNPVTGNVINMLPSGSSTLVDNIVVGATTPNAGYQIVGFFNYDKNNRTGYFTRTLNP